MFKHEYRSNTNEKTIVVLDECLAVKLPMYPKHVLHPEVTPSLHDVSAELYRRRHVRLLNRLTDDDSDVDSSNGIANVYHDDMAHAVDHRLVCYRCS
jgi:hypothetical protein